MAIARTGRATVQPYASSWARSAPAVTILDNLLLTCVQPRTVGGIARKYSSALDVQRNGPATDDWSLLRPKVMLAVLGFFRFDLLTSCFDAALAEEVKKSQRS